jgi:Transposase DDE domain
MTSVRTVARTLQTVLTEEANEAGRFTQCIRRQGKFTGSSLCQTLVFGWLANPRASLSALCQTAAACGVEITPQGLDQRFTFELAACLELVLDAAVRQVIQADARVCALFDRFPAVVVQDTSTISLPAGLVELWRGCGTAQTKDAGAAVKVGVGYDLRHGALLGPTLAAGRTHDREVAAQHAPLAPGTLLLQDLGHFSCRAFAEHAAAGTHLVSRLQHGTSLFHPDGTRLVLRSLLETTSSSVDLPVLVGARDRVPLRLVAVPVPQWVADQRRRRMREEGVRRGQMVQEDRLALAAWTILVTTIPTDELSVTEVLVLARARWQIELLFKLWKQHGLVDEWRTQNEARILCEVYAKLIGVVIQHWLILVGPWRDCACSLTKAATAVRLAAWQLAWSVGSIRRCCMTIRQIVTCAAAGSRINPRSRRPNAYQCWLDPALASYA